MSERQLLTRRVSMPVEDAVAHLVGMQAQAVRPPYIGLWTRLTEFATEDLAALLLDRRVVRIALMRSTIHLVTARDSLTLRPLLADMLARIVAGQFGRNVAGLDAAELVALATKLVEEEALTFADLGKLLVARWPERDGNALAQTVRNLVPLVQIPPRGLWDNSGPAIHTTLSAWLDHEANDEPSIDEYVLRYLRAFGPASVADIQKWSGLTRLAAVFQRLGSQLRGYRDEQGIRLFDLADATLPDADSEVPVRFLPEFDNVLLSYAKRDRILSEEYRPRVFTSNGIIRSTILVDGFVQGRWRIDMKKDVATLVIEPFIRFPKQIITAATEEGALLLQFAAPEARHHDIRFEPFG
ncbi:MAG: hypothetical protein JWQ39_2057 [Glaciihabitans sp.]|nr:hypothetical protein [Glaciihabitans sp.]